MKRLIKCNEDAFNSMYQQLESEYGNHIPLGEYIGSDRAHDCDKNSYRHRKDYEVYVGKVLVPAPHYTTGWNVIGHVFNVKDGEVFEFTNLDGIDTKDAYYFGKPYKGSLKDIWSSETVTASTKTVKIPKGKFEGISANLLSEVQYEAQRNYLDYQFRRGGYKFYTKPGKEQYTWRWYAVPANEETRNLQ